MGLALSICCRATFYTARRRLIRRRPSGCGMKPRQRDAGSRVAPLWRLVEHWNDEAHQQDGVSACSGDEVQQRQGMADLHARLCEIGGLGLFHRKWGNGRKIM